MSEKKMSYCLDLLNRVRLNTKQVVIGELSLGGESPIRVQSMTTTDTMDTEGSVEPVSYTHLTLPTICSV